MLCRKGILECIIIIIKGHGSIENEERRRRLSTSTDEQHVNTIENLVHVNYRMTVKDLADVVGILKTSVNTILKDILGHSRHVPKQTFHRRTDEPASRCCRQGYR